MLHLITEAGLPGSSAEQLVGTPRGESKALRGRREPRRRGAMAPRIRNEDSNLLFYTFVQVCYYGFLVTEQEIFRRGFFYGGVTYFTVDAMVELFNGNWSMIPHHAVGLALVAQIPDLRADQYANYGFIFALAEKTSIVLNVRARRKAAKRLGPHEDLLNWLVYTVIRCACIPMLTYRYVEGTWSAALAGSIVAMSSAWSYDWARKWLRRYGKVRGGARSAGASGAAGKGVPTPATGSGARQGSPLRARRKAA